MTNNADLDQLTSETNRSGATLLAKAGHIQVHRARVKIQSINLKYFKIIKKSYSFISQISVYITDHHTVQLIASTIIATDKRGYPHNIFLTSPRKHMLWVLIRSASPRRF